MPYQANDVWLHTDAGCLPVRRKGLGQLELSARRGMTGRALVTYNMNILQGLKLAAALLRQPQSRGRVDERRCCAASSITTPVFNQGSIAAQSRRAEICGRQHTHFCGAYWYNGFHEDGVRSALDVASRFGARL